MIRARTALLALFSFVGASPTSSADSVVLAGESGFGVAFGCGPSGNPPPLGTPDSFVDGADLIDVPSGNTSNWHGWGSVSWNVSTSPTGASIVASGGSKEGFNGAVCTQASGSNGFLYGQGQGSFEITLLLLCDHDYTSTLSGDVVGIDAGTGTLPQGIHTIKAETVGASGGYSINVALAPSGSQSSCAKFISPTMTCPPGGYALEGQAPPPQPPLNVDLDGDGELDAWSATPAEIVDCCTGHSFPLTDEAGTRLEYFCVAGDPPGSGGDHYSPRIFEPGGPLEGIELGQCVWEPAGKNFWGIDFEDVNGDGVADEFKSSLFVSAEAGGSGNQGLTGRYVFCAADLTVDQLSICEMGPPAGDVAGAAVQIVDAVVVPLGTPLESVLLNGQPLAKPGNGGGGFQVGGPDSFEVEHGLAALTPEAIVGQIVRASGAVRNTSDATVVFEFEFEATNAQVLATPGPTTLAPGAQLDYTVEALVTAPGTVAIFAAAVASIDSLGFASAVFVAGGPPWSGLGGGIPGAFGIPSLVGQGQLSSGSTASVYLGGTALDAAGALVVGPAATNLPLFGGVLIPSPDLVLPLVTSSLGDYSVQAIMTGAIQPGAQLFFQAWVIDEVATMGVAASNGLVATSQ